MYEYVYMYVYMHECVYVHRYICKLVRLKINTIDIHTEVKRYQPEPDADIAMRMR